MSTQNPFQSEPVLCSTNWYTRLACKLQKMVEPLCEKRSDFALNLYEQNEIARDLRVTNNLSGWHSSDSLGSQALTSKQWLDIIASNNLVCSEGTMKLLSLRLTVWNKLGLAVWKAFSVGTSCSCCWAYRLIAVVATTFCVGFSLGKIL